AIDVFANFGEQFRAGLPPVGSTMQAAVAARVIVVPIVAGSIGVFPIVSVRVIEAEFHSVFLAGGLELFHGIATERGRFDNVIVGDFGVIHREAVMMFGGNNEVAHAGFFGGANP